MKKTISINLAGLVYQIDDDAYNLLEKYLDKLKTSFSDPSEQREILDDIEHRFAELFSEKMKNRTEVVNKKMVQEAIATLGEVEEIEVEVDNSTAGQSTRSSRKLFRSTDDKVIAGVLGGLGVYFGIDAIWLRLLFVLLAIASVGIPVGIIYIVLWLVMPKAVTASQKLQMRGEPVNLSNLKDNIKKNLSSEGLSATGSRVADGFGEIFRLSAKTIALVIGAILSLKLFVFAFVWFFSSFFVHIMGSEYLGLIFNANWHFVLASIAIFTMVALPFILLVYILFNIAFQQKITWGRTLITSAVIWFLALLTTSIIAFTIAQNYKVESVGNNYVELPYRDSLQELKIEMTNELEDEDFKFVYKQGKFKSGGFEYNNKDLKLNSIALQVKPSDNNSFSLEVSKSSRGKTKEDADAHLEKFNYNVELIDGETLRLPMTLTLNDEFKFRAQRMKYILSVPIGQTISFPDHAHYYIENTSLKSEYKKSQLDENTWLMTNNGLECLSCEEIFEDDDYQELDEILEEYIEEELNNAFEDEMSYQQQLEEDTIKEAKAIEQWLANHPEKVS